MKNYIDFIISAELKFKFHRGKMLCFEKKMRNHRYTYENNFRIKKNFLKYLIRSKNVKFTDFAFIHSAELLESMYLGNENIYLRTEGFS